MKVAFYVDIKDHVLIAERAIAAVREVMPDAEIWHLTNMNGPKLSADKCLRMDVRGTFVHRKAVISAAMTGDVLYVDVDVVIRADVSRVFDDDFDVCVTTDMAPGADGVTYNAGVIFCRNPEYWKKIDADVGHLDFGKSAGDWEPIEKGFAAVADSGFKLKVLDGQEYNYVPRNAEDVQGKIMHYRGKRKAWMIPITGFETSLNTSMDTMIAQSEVNLARDLPIFIEQAENVGTAIIVGGGPSLKDSLTDIRMHHDRGGIIFALNATHDYLIERGIVPEFHVLLDARADNAAFVRKPHKAVTYLVASQCHPDVFDALGGFSVTQWAACCETDEQDNALASKFPNIPLVLIGGGATVGLKTLNLAYLWGFRKFRMYGMDSSYSDGENHAYRQELNDKESRMDIHAGGRDFICAPWMAKQATEFQRQYRQLTELGCKIKVCGDGLIPHIYKQLEAQNVV